MNKVYRQPKYTLSFKKRDLTQTASPFSFGEYLEKQALYGG
jgi:hypothetical protein